MWNDIKERLSIFTAQENLLEWKDLTGKNVLRKSGGWSIFAICKRQFWCSRHLHDHVEQQISRILKRVNGLRSMTELSQILPFNRDFGYIIVEFRHAPSKVNFKLRLLLIFTRRVHRQPRSHEIQVVIFEARNAAKETRKSMSYVSCSR